MPEPTFLPPEKDLDQNEYGERGVTPIMNRDGDLRVAQRLAPKLNMARNFQITDGGLNPKRSIMLTAGAATTLTGGANPNKVAYTTSGMNIWHLDYDSASTESAEWTLFMPTNYDAGPLRALFVWTSVSTTIAGVKWSIQGTSLQDDDLVDTAMGTAQEVLDYNTLTADTLHISDYTPAFTLGGSPGPDALTQIRVSRDTSDADDTLAADARLIAVKLLYHIKQYSD